MKRRINHRWQSLPLATIIFLLGVPASAFAQSPVTANQLSSDYFFWPIKENWFTNNLTSTFVSTDDYPKPDFSEMEKYYTIVKYDYEVMNTDAKLYIVVKPKVEKRPAFTIKFLDADGVPVIEENFLTGLSIFTAVGDTEKAMAYTPSEKNMERVKSVVILRRRL